MITSVLSFTTTPKLLKGLSTIAFLALSSDLMP